MFSRRFVEKSWWFRDDLLKHRASLVLFGPFGSLFIGQLSLFPIINFSSNNSNLFLGLLSILMQFNCYVCNLEFIFKHVIIPAINPPSHILSNVSNITHRLEIIKYRSSYQGNWNDFSNFEDTKHQSYNNQTYRLVPYLNPYLKQHQYQINSHRFAGFNQYDIKNKQFLNGQIIGTGHYENNIRIGKWLWKTMDDNKLAIKGQYNEKASNSS